MKKTKVFEADDGATFETAAECRSYEEQEELIAIIGDMCRSEVSLALARHNTHLADAIERAGNIIAAKRRESGELKRKRAGAGVDAAVEERRIKENMKVIS